MIISITSSKGGVGKSTITSHLATILSKTNSVLVIDCDNQQSISDTRNFEQNNNFEGMGPPFALISMNVASIKDQLKKLTKEYDYTFIDFPRISSDDNTTIKAMFYCDIVIVPVVASNTDIFSTIRFLKSLDDIKFEKSKKGFDFHFFGFLNKKNRRKENSEIIPYLQKNGLQMFDSSLADIKLLSYSDTFSSLLDSKKGKERFEPFYKEFLQKIESHG